MPAQAEAVQPSLFAGAKTRRASSGAGREVAAALRARASGESAGTTAPSGPPEEGGAGDVVRTPMAEWPARDRPLEKLMCGAGPAALSNAELVALLIPSGATCPETGTLLTRLDVARSLLAGRGSLEAVLTARPHALAACPGISRQVAGAIRSAGVLAGRLEAEQAGRSERLQITCPEDVARAYGPELRELDHEVFMTLFLSTSNVVESSKIISEGGLAASIVEPRAIYREAVLRNAAAVVFLHNHPSTNCEPSREDEKITRQLAEAGKLMGIRAHDHLIIGGRGYTSLAERGVL